MEVPCLKVGEITDKKPGEASSAIRTRVENARIRQRERYRSERISANAELESRGVTKYCVATEEAEGLLKMAIQELGFSARAYHKSLKVAKTIADLEESDLITATHISEAIHYRALDKNFWFR